jgi:Uma2 family endonuclease
MAVGMAADREYRDGVLVERTGGNREHARLQVKLAMYAERRERQWGVSVYISLQVKVREGWYAIPDVCVYGTPDCEGPYPSEPPLLWIEILSPDDRMVDVWSRSAELVANGVPYVWIIDPETLESELRAGAGVQTVAEKTLRLPDSPIVIPLRNVMEE